MGFSTGLRSTQRGRQLSGVPIGPDDLNHLFEAVVDATEEAVLNSMVNSPTMHGRDGNAREGLPLDKVQAIIAAHHPSPR